MSAYYKYMGGTSMATPLTAGGVAVLRDFYDDVYGHDASAALIKATLINSAVDMADENNDGVNDNDFPIPNVHEGWGLVDLDNATDESHQYVDDTTGVGTAQTASHSFDIAVGGDFRVSLVWSDFPSTAAAATNLVNDLDLVVTAPDGSTSYLGNVFSGGWSTTGGAADATNNVENVYVANALAGTWTVDVSGANVPNGPQPFALVIDADFAQGGGTGPDIVIENLGTNIYWTPGELTTAFWFVKNIGTETVTNSYRDNIYLSADAILDGSDVLLGSRNHEFDVFEIVPGASHWSGVVVFTVPASTAEGAWYFLVEGDGDNNVAESDETNNVTAHPVSVFDDVSDGMDIVVENVTASNILVSEGDSIDVNWIVKNIGTETIPNSYREIVYLSADQLIDGSDVELASSHTHDDGVPLPSGSSHGSGTVSVTIPVGTAQGTWRLLVEGDADNAVAESVEANNIGFVSINVTGENTGGADIVTQITQLSTRNVDPGDVVTMTWFVRNIGTETANNAYSEKVFLSANTTLDASDTQIGSGITSNNAGPLRPGTIGFSTEDVSIPPGTALGSWYILVEGDAGAVVAESDETNNVSVAPITVVDTTPPVVTPPADVTVEASGPTAPVSLGSASASDDVDGSLTPTPDITGPFAVGATTVTWSATDGAGNTGTATQTVTVTDTTAPVVTPPANITVEATGASGAVVGFALPAANDLADPAPTVVAVPASGSTFALGATIVTVTATDASNNSSQVTFTVTVTDTTPPAVTPPADVTAEAMGTLTPVSIGAATADDLVDGAVLATSDAPAQFPLGATVVTWSATDAAGNSASATQTVTVADTTAPVVTAPADVTAEATGTLTPVSIGAATADDLVDGAVLATSDAPAQFPLGATVVTWSATDAAGNSASATQTVTVTDSTAPAVTAPADVTAEATGTLTTVSIGAATADDLVDGAVAATSDAPAQFPLGATVVTWSATDAAGNSASATQTVTVADTTAPAVTAPADVTAEATGTLTTVSIGAATADDLVDGAVAATSDAPTQFPLGATVVTWSATDAAGNSASATQTVTVADTTAPVVTAPADVTTEATGTLTTVSLGAATADDLVDGSLTPTPDNSGPFPVGVTVVTWSATDSASNVGTATQTVTVTDSSSPTVTPPADITTEATGPTTPVSLGTATALDDVDGPLTPTPDITGPFLVGLTTVTWSATDTAGNEGSASQNVTVTDLTPPTVSPPADVTVEATGEFTEVALGSAAASDLVDGSLTPTPDNSGPFPVGVTVVTWSATDAAGNSASATQTVTVADTTAPAVTAPADVTAEATGTLTTVSIGAATADDLVDGAVAATSDAPAQFPLGATVVTWSATDAAGNSASATQTVTVTDSTAPAVTAPADVTAEATGTLTTVSLGAATADDLVDSAVAATSDAPAQFPLGATVVTWSATDAAGNSASATQTVTVTDSTAPAVTAPADVTAEATGTLTTVSLGAATADDLVDGAVAATSDAPAQFPLGATVVTWSATDAAGNSASATQTVTVADTTAPAVTAPADVTAEATGTLTTVSIGAATADDLVDGAVAATSDAPAQFPLGATVVTWSATDAAGNSASATQTVTVADTTAPAVTGRPT